MLTSEAAGPWTFILFYGGLCEWGPGRPFLNSDPSSPGYELNRDRAGCGTYWGTWAALTTAGRLLQFWIRRCDDCAAHWTGFGWLCQLTGIRRLPGSAGRIWTSLAAAGDRACPFSLIL